MLNYLGRSNILNRKVKANYLGRINIEAPGGQRHWLSSAFSSRYPRWSNQVLGGFKDHGDHIIACTKTKVIIKSCPPTALVQALFCYFNLLPSECDCSIDQTSTAKLSLGTWSHGHLPGLPFIAETLGLKRTRWVLKIHGFDPIIIKP